MEDMTLDTARYIWTEGNYSCDCNRAGFLGFDEDFDCGEDIELIEYVMTYQPVPKVGLQTIWYDKEIGEGSFGNLEASDE
ncbi:MAG TPA: hypothetical protein VJ907_05930, partial [Halanaerobiales bacterium]|nr:hypothetical protein [Halanaerobiales bacterium]